MDSNDKKGAGTIRARNKTVMLSPEITGQVRAKLASEAVARPGSAGVDSRKVAVESSGGLHRTVPNAGAAIQSRSATIMVPPDDVSRVRSAPLPDPLSSHQDLPTRSASGYANPGFGGQRTNAGSYGAPPLRPEPVEETTAASAHHAEPAPPQEPQHLTVSYTKKGVLVGFLITQHFNEEGDFVPLYAGRMMVSGDLDGVTPGATPGQWNKLVLKDESVSGMHAIMKVQGGEIQVLDQLSEHGTKIIKTATAEELELTNGRGTLEHGDTVIFGNVALKVCLVP
jgi:hypothetical protein